MIRRNFCKMIIAFLIFMPIAPMVMHADSMGGPGLSPSPSSSRSHSRLPPPKSKQQQVVKPQPVEQPFVMPRYQPHHLDKNDDSDALYRNYWKGQEQYAPKN